MTFIMMILMFYRFCRQYSLIFNRPDVKKNKLSFETLSDALKRFEKSSAYLVSNAFFATGCSEIKRQILQFLSILLLEGVEYRLADPKKRIYDYIVSSIKNAQYESLQVFSDLFNFLIILSTVDATYSKPADLEKALITIIDNTKLKDIEYLFSSIGMFISFNMLLTNKSINDLKKKIVINFQPWLFLNPVKVLQIYEFLLCCSKKDKDKLL